MLSKYKIWEYSKLGDYAGQGPGKLLAYKCYDSFAFKYIKKSFNKALLAEQKFFVWLGSEVSKEWVENQFLSLNLFGNTESILIQNAEDIAEDVQLLLLEVDDLLLDNRFLILSFNRDCPFWKALIKKKDEKLLTMEIIPPAFWEDTNLLSYVSSYFNISLSRDVFDYIIEHVPCELEKYTHILEQLCLKPNHLNHFTVSDVVSLIGVEKLDQFAILELFATKKMSFFYKKVIHLLESGQDLSSLLYLIQSHFIKLYDLSFLESKNKLSKYDRGLQSQSRIWNKCDIEKVMNYIGELIILSKTNNGQLEQKLKSDYLKLVKF